MTLKEVLAKLRAGEALSPEEEAFLAKIDENYIPRTRLNEEIAAKKLLGDKLQLVEPQLVTAQGELKKLQDAGVPEADKAIRGLREEITTLSASIETLKTEKAQESVQRQQAQKKLRIRELATSNPTGATVNDPDYLEFLMVSQNVDPENTEQVKPFMEGLRKNKPDLFVTSVSGGSGSGAVKTVPKAVVSPDKKPWEMSLQEKSAFIEANGAAAWQKHIETHGVVNPNPGK